MRLYYAQNKEDLLIRSFFPDVEKGFYIDVGANDPVLDSVTKLFYDDGWNGINVEPIRRHHEALQRTRPRDLNLQIGLSSTSGVLTFTEYPEGDGLSTFDATIQSYYEKGDHPFPTGKVEKYEVPVRTLNEVVAEAKPKHIHFIKIDVEGYEYEVIEGYDWKKIRPELICIEANHISKDWRPLLKKQRYHAVFFDGVNDYYLAEESLHRRDLFNYPNAVFAGNPTYQPAYVEIEKDVEWRANQKIQELNKVIADREHKIAELHGLQRDVRFLAKRLVAEVQLRVNRRAKGVSRGSQLTYKNDPRIEEFLKNKSTASKQEALSFIKARDQVNITRQKTSFKQLIKTWFWKIAAKMLRGTVVVGGKIARRLV